MELHGAYETKMLDLGRMAAYHHKMAEEIAVKFQRHFRSSLIGATHLALMLLTFTVDATDGSKKPGFSWMLESDKSYLTIKAIEKGGLFDAKNQDNPDKKIYVPDQIVAVNGKTGDALSMANELALPKLLTITLRRCEEDFTPQECWQVAPTTPKLALREAPPGTPPGPAPPGTPPGPAPHTPRASLHSPHTPQD